MAANRSLRAAQEVLENIPRDTPDELFELATVYGALATPDEGATEPTEAERDDQQRYADLGDGDDRQGASRKAIENLKALQSHKHLAALREREDFQQLVATGERDAGRATGHEGGRHGRAEAGQSPVRPSTCYGN